MAVSEVEAVLKFLRKNGFSEAESALKEDMVRKGDLGSSDYEKFLFPMVPPPPPVRIPASSLRSDFSGGGGDGSRSSSVSSDDEFVSLGSSTSDVCSSEFTNPYGIRSTSPGNSNSKSSSDELSQFGTARDYPDFDMQNDLFWYNEKDDGDFLSPSFEGPEFFGCPSEDKFIMTSDLDKHWENQSELNKDSKEFQSDVSIDYLDKACHFSVAPAKNESEVPLIDYYHFDNSKQIEAGVEGDHGGCLHFDCSEPFCNCATEGRGNPEKEEYLSKKQTAVENSDVKLVEDIAQPDTDHAQRKGIDNSIDHTAQMDSTYYRAEDFDGSSDLHVKLAKKDFLSNGTNKYKLGNYDMNEEANELEAAANSEDIAADEILMCNTNEDEYEVFDLRIIHRKNRTGFEENKDLPIVLNTVIAGRYYVTEYLGSAAFSKVVQAHDLHTGVDVCLKIIKNDKDFFDQSLDEIKLLKLVNKNDPADECHILRLYDYFYHQEHLFIVCELLRANLYEFQKFNQESGGEAYFTLRRLQVITRQCLEALEFLHDLGIIHCDLKPENILIKSYKRCEIKVIDLGSSCFQSDNLCLYVQSRSYRAPEVILGLPYDNKIDLWSLGCILAELCSGEVLFPNDGVVLILARIIGLLGPIDLDMLERGRESSKYFSEEFDLYHLNEETDQLEYIIPEESSLEDHLRVTDIGFIDFLRSLLEINPQRRLTAKEALQHPWLSQIYLSSSC
ncbi:Serine/threonine protein kinase [Trema orientale]|uniref:Serine/threonine protein kinase n=1 Tax=Trema orientale TaxID=63057 RepID=A0A2P5EM03_TREOI|nr:Serine/threonine protein kinase [Trema orientale]